MIDKIERMIQEFLSEPRRSDGGWAEVKQEDMEQFHEIIYALTTAKWEADPDGDYPVEYGLVDRTKYEPTVFSPAPYWHEAQTDQDRVSIILCHISNARATQSRLDMMLRLWYSEMAGQLEQD